MNTVRQNAGLDGYSGLLLPYAGFTLIEGLVIVAIVGILVAAAMPAVSALNEDAKRARCVSQLREIAAVKRAWVADHMGDGSPTVSEQAAFMAYFPEGTKEITVCPKTGKPYDGFYDVYKRTGCQSCDPEWGGLPTKNTGNTN